MGNKHGCTGTCAVNQLYSSLLLNDKRYQLLVFCHIKNLWLHAQPIKVKSNVRLNISVDISKKKYRESSKFGNHMKDTCTSVILKTLTPY